MFDIENCNDACRAALEKISDGDLCAVTVIYERLGRQIIALGRTVTGDHAYAEDVLQETILKIISRIDTYRRDGNAKAWIMSIARNTAIDIKNGMRTEISFDENFETQKLDSQFSPYSIDLENAMMKLDEIDRQIIVLKVMSGLRHKDIANIVGLSIDAVKKRYRRALTKLKKLLK